MSGNNPNTIDQSNLPNLPGFRINVDLRQRFHKSHLFDICNGVPVSDLAPNSISKDQQEQLAAAATQQLNNQENQSVFANRNNKSRFQQPPNVTDKSLLPRWVQYDRKVLRFYAYFIEPVHNSAIEKQRVRKCVIYYYLSDHTIMITDVREVNSGIPQGKFLKRQKVKSATHPGWIHYEDFQIGEDIRLFGRGFTIVDADESTRKFCQSESEANQGSDKKKPWILAEAIEYPKDDYIKHLEQTEYYKQQSSQSQNDVRSYVEANLGRVSSERLQKSKKYLANDRKVLRFWGIWDDPSLYGSKKYYEINYFLADDTMEVVERKSMESKHSAGLKEVSIEQKRGQSQPAIVFPTLLTRRTLPKQTLPQGCILGQSEKAGITNDLSNLKISDENSASDQNGEQQESNTSSKQGSEEPSIYTHADLRIGTYINIYGRQVLLAKADQFTIDWYKAAHGYTDADFQEIEQLPPPKEVDDDGPSNEAVNTAVSGFAFNNRPPPKDPAKMMKYDKCALRFLAKFNDNRPENAARRFVIEFHLGDDTVSIFERNVRNSGFVAGKFLERSKIRNPDKDGSWFHCEDFYVGANLKINGFKFSLLETDVQTKNIMNDNIEVFTRFTPQQILKGLADKLWDRSYNQTATFRFVDADHDRLISPSELKELCKKYGWVLNPNQLKALFDYFDKDGSGQIDADEFFQSLHQYKLDAVERSTL